MRGHHGAARGAGIVVALRLAGRGASLQVGGTEFKERGSQEVLGERVFRHSSSDCNNTGNSIMGYGGAVGALTLVNGSPFEWTLSSQSSYQMDTWKWPNVAAGTNEMFCYYTSTLWY